MEVTYPDIIIMRATSDTGVAPIDWSCITKIMIKCHVNAMKVVDCIYVSVWTQRL